MRLRTMGVVVAVAAVVATGAFGGLGGGTITTIAGSGKPGFSPAVLAAAFKTLRGAPATIAYAPHP